MQIGVIGINHKSADLEFREFFAKVCQRRFDPLLSLHPSLSYVLLITCNRTEIYFHASDLSQIHCYLLSVLRHDIPEEFEHKVYSYFGTECFIHLAMVTSGLDSALIAETEIQGQVKKAYENFSNNHSLSSELHFLFQKCLKIGKQIRSSFSQKLSFRAFPSMGEIILRKTAQLLGDPQKRRFLFVGASEINRKILHEFKSHKIHQMTICNRSLANAEKWGWEYGMKILNWERMKDALIDYDVILCATKASDYLIKTEDIDESENKILIDLSVPRNIDPRIGNRCGKRIQLFNVDHLSGAVNQTKKYKALQLAHFEKKIVAEEAIKQVSLFLSREKAKLQWAIL